MKNLYQTMLQLLQPHHETRIINIRVYRRGIRIQGAGGDSIFTEWGDIPLWAHRDILFKFSNEITLRQEDYPMIYRMLIGTPVSCEVRCVNDSWACTFSIYNEKLRRASSFITTKRYSERPTAKQIWLDCRKEVLERIYKKGLFE